MTILEILVILYLLGLMFHLGAGIADEMSFVNPNYRGVVIVSICWPLFIVLALVYRYTGSAWAKWLLDLAWTRT